jgi:ligand-binding sensor domain-containing protein
MVHCNYCNVMVQATASGMPRDPMAMARPASSGSRAALGIGCVVAGFAAVFLFGGAWFFFMMRTSSSSTPIVAIATPPIPTIPAIDTTASLKKAAPLAVWGESGNGAGQLTDARALAVDMDENVYVADRNTLRVQKFDATGKYQWIVQVPKDEFAGNKAIWALAVDSKNILWVNRDAALFKYTLDGKPAGQINGNYDDKTFKFVAVDAVGNVATMHSEGGDTALLLMDSNGKIRKRIKNKPDHALAMDGAGNVYLSDPFDGTIEVIDSTGATKSKFGSAKDKHLSNVGAIAVDGKGHIFAATSEGLDVFDQGGGFIKTIEAAPHSPRAFAISVKNHLFVLDNDKVTELDIGALP